MAEEAVGKIDAVRGVANALEVNVSYQDKKNDADIVQAALNSLRWTVFLPDEKTKVAVENGCLILVGEVE